MLLNLTRGGLEVLVLKSIIVVIAVVVTVCLTAGTCRAQTVAELSLEEAYAALAEGRFTDARTGFEQAASGDGVCRARALAWIASLDTYDPIFYGNVQWNQGRAWRLAPDDGDVWAAIAYSWHSANAPEDAFRAAKRAVQAGASTCEPEFILMTAAAMRGGRSEVLRLGALVLAAPCRHPDSWMSGTAIGLSTQEPDVARARVMEMSAADDATYITHLCCALAAGRVLGDSPLTNRELSLAAELLPDDYRAVLQTARIMLEARQEDRALALLERYEQRMPLVKSAHFWNAHMMMRAGASPDAVIQEFGMAQMLDSANPHIRFAMGKALYNAYRTDDAWYSFREAAALDSTFAAASMMLSAIEEERGNWTECLLHARRATRHDTTDFLSWSMMGRALTELGRDREALTAQRTVVRLAPLVFEGHADLLLSLIALEMHEDALEAAMEAYRACSPHAPAAYDVGVALWGIGRFEEAIPYFEEAVRLDSRLDDAWANLGAAYSACERNEEAFAALARALELDPRDAAARTTLGGLYMISERFEEAARELAAALELDPSSEQVRRNLAYALTKLERASEGAAVLEAGGESSGDGDPVAVRMRAETLMRAGLFGEARGLYLQLVERDEAGAEDYANLGVACEELGFFGDAEEAARKALALEPALLEVRYNLGAVLQTVGRYAEAAALYEDELSRNPDHAKCYGNLSAIRALAEDYEGASELAARAVELDPSYYIGYTNLSQSLIKLGRGREAAAAARGAINVDPDNEIGWYLLGGACLADGNRECAREAVRELDRLESRLAVPLRSMAGI